MFRKKRTQRITATVILVIIVAMLLTTVLPYLI